MSPGSIGLTHYTDHFEPKQSPKADHGLAVTRNSAQSAYETHQLESAISRLGSSAHTAWLEPQCKIFTHEENGAIIGVVGYIVSKGHAVVLGEPLIELDGRTRQSNVALSFERNMISRDLVPVWTCVSQNFLEGLSREDHIIIKVAQEDVIDPQAHLLKTKIRQKVARALRQGVSVAECKMVDQSFEAEVEILVQRWYKEHKGLQLFSTRVRPFQHRAYRRWFCARDLEGRMCALITLTRLDAYSGYAVEYLTTDPDVPQGTPEFLVQRVIEVLKLEGCAYLTFGISAADKITGINISGWKFEWAAKIYNGIYEGFGLGKRSYFRSKFGINVHTPLYVGMQRTQYSHKLISAVVKSYVSST